MLLLRQVESSGHGSSPPPRRPPGSLGAELVNRRAHWKGFPNAAVTSALSPRPDFLGGRPRTPSRPPARPSPPRTAGRGLGPGGQAGVTLGAAGQAWWGRGRASYWLRCRPISWRACSCSSQTFCNSAFSSRSSRSS